MAAQDIKAEVDAWVADQIGKQCFGEDYGYAVAWGPAPVPRPDGQMVIVPAWTAVITCLSPLAGEGSLFHLAQLGASRPREADVRHQVTDGIRQLRELARSKLAGPNGALAVPG